MTRLLSYVIQSPFFIFPSVFFLGGVLYQLRLSGLYSGLSETTLITLVTTCLISFLYGCFTLRATKGKLNESKNIFLKNDSSPLCRFIVFATIPVLMVYAVEIAYNGKIPILEIVYGRPYDYRDFTVPVIHVFFTSFVGFYGICSLSIYVCYKKKPFALGAILAIAIFASLMYRSNIIALALSYTLVFIWNRRFDPKMVLRVFLCAVLVLLLFGLAGEMRSSSQVMNDGSGDFSLADATEAVDLFQGNQIGGGLYWSYIYFTSPLANLQLSVETFEKVASLDRIDPLTKLSGFQSIILHEVLPDIIGKRIADANGIDAGYSPLQRIIDFLNVGTVFGDAFCFGGIGGCLIVSIYMFTIATFAILMSRPGLSFIVLLSSLCTLFALCIFDNMCNYCSIGLIPVYSLAFQRFDRQHVTLGVANLDLTQKEMEGQKG